MILIGALVILDLVMMSVTWDVPFGYIFAIIKPS